MDKSGGRPKKETSGYKKEETSGYFQKKPNVNDNDNVNDNVSDSCVEGFQVVVDFYSNNINLVTPYVLEVLSDYSKTMSNDLLILAMKKAVEANKKTIQYIKGILNNWTKKEIKTVVDVLYEEELKKTKESNKASQSRTKSKNEGRKYSADYLNSFCVNLNQEDVQNEAIIIAKKRLIMQIKISKEVQKMSKNKRILTDEEKQKIAKSKKELNEYRENIKYIEEKLNDTEEVRCKVEKVTSILSLSKSNSNTNSDKFAEAIESEEN